MTDLHENHHEFLDNEKIYHLLNQFFDLAQTLFDIKLKKPIHENKSLGIYQFNSIEFLIDETTQKIIMDVEYSWWQKDIADKKRVYNHDDHYIFDDKSFIQDYMNYFKDTIFEKPLMEMFNFLDKEENLQILQPHIAQLKLSHKPSLFNNAKNEVISEKIRNTHEAYALTQNILNKSECLIQKNSNKIKL